MTNVIAIAAGGYHSLALKADGTVAAWGSSSHGQSTVPLGLAGVVALAAGTRHSLALKTNGTLVSWGDNANGQTSLPLNLTNLIGIAGGERHTLVLAAGTTPVPRILRAGWQQNRFSVVVQTLHRHDYALQYQDDFGAGNWNVAAVSNGNGGLRMVQDNSGNAARRFYRVHYLP
jgi:hypothetical protein